MSEAETNNRENPEPYSANELVFDYSPEIEASKRRLIGLGFLVILLGIGGLGAWAAYAPLQSAAVAPGVVKVASERKIIQHLEGGIVNEILVKEGDEVSAGQVLIRLDNVTAMARKRLLQGRLDGFLATTARLEAERGDRDEIEFPRSLVERRDEEGVAKVVATQKQLFQTRLEALQGETNVLKQRILQLNEQVSGEEEQIRSTRIQLSTIREELTAAEKLYKKGIYEKPKYLKLKRDAARLRGQIARHQSRIAEIKQRIGEIELRVIDLKKQRREEVDVQLQKIQSSVFDTTEQLNAAEDTLRRVEIRAPQDGTVVGLVVHTVGGVIKSGVEILGIVPKGDRMIVEAQVKPIDIDVVHEGLAAEVRLSAFDMRTTPSLPGVLTHVSADSFQSADPRLPTFYRARIEIKPEHLNDLQLYPGMPAEVFILTGKSTALDYLLKPIQDAVRRGMREQ